MNIANENKIATRGSDLLRLASLHSRESSGNGCSEQNRANHSGPFWWGSKPGRMFGLAAPVFITLHVWPQQCPVRFAAAMPKALPHLFFTVSGCLKTRRQKKKLDHFRWSLLVVHFPLPEICTKSRTRFACNTAGPKFTNNFTNNFTFTVTNNLLFVSCS